MHMMCDFFIVIQFVVATQSYAKELTASHISDTPVSMDRFVDVLISKALKSSVHHSDLDDTTFAKPSLNARPTRSMPLDLHAMPSAELSMQPGRMIPKGPHKMIQRTGAMGHQALPMGSQANKGPANLQNQRRVGLRANPIRTSQFGASQVRASTTTAKTKVFELKKPLGIALEPKDGKKGAKIVDVITGSNAAKAGVEMSEDLGLLSVNGKPCAEAPYEEIMAYLKDLPPEMVIKVELEGIEEEEQNAPGVITELKVKLDPKDAPVPTWAQGTTTDGRKVMVLLDVPKGSKAWQEGMRKNMVLAQLTGGAGAEQDRDWDIDRLGTTSMREFNDKILLSLRAIEFKLLKGVTLTDLDTSGETSKDIPQVNASYGFGTNELSSGQKDLLIYGSLVAFFALFIAGYGLN